MLTEKEIQSMGFAAVGKDVLISEKASFYLPEKITIGDHSRIDDYCVISAGEGGIDIGRNVHIAVYVAVLGKGRVELGDFSGLSGRTIVYSSNDDYSGNYLTNPTVPAEFTNVTHKDVRVGKHGLVGAGCVLLPGVKLGEGTIVGAMSLVKPGEYGQFLKLAGVPAKIIGERSRKLLELEKEYVS